jgi:hypothetical protein
MTLRVQEQDLRVYIRNELPNGVQLSGGNEDEVPCARRTMLSTVSARCESRDASIG